MGVVEPVQVVEFVATVALEDLPKFLDERGLRILSVTEDLVFILVSKGKDGEG